MRIRYLLYVSRLSESEGPGSVPPIIRAARSNNRIRGISGALVFDGERFCQYIEGGSDEIERTFAAIVADVRHTAVWVLARGFVDARRFERWSMGYAYATTPDGIAGVSCLPASTVVDGFVRLLDGCDVDV